MATVLDHLVVAAATLDEGVAWCEVALGVTPGPGGRHPHMGTHNRLLPLGGAAFPQAYFEIIALDPEAAAPVRPRWFGLDTPELQAALARGPQLIHWVARSEPYDATRAALEQLGHGPGTPLPAHRDTPQGRLAWRTTVRDDGRPLAGGALPTLIAWDGPHPTTRMPPPVLALRSLTLRGLPPAVRDALQLQGVDVADEAGPALTATFTTPRGAVTLTSPMLLP